MSMVVVSQAAGYVSPCVGLVRVALIRWLDLTIAVAIVLGLPPLQTAQSNLDPVDNWGNPSRWSPPVGLLKSFSHNAVVQTDPSCHPRVLCLDTAQLVDRPVLLAHGDLPAAACRRTLLGGAACCWACAVRC